MQQEQPEAAQTTDEQYHGLDYLIKQHRLDAPEDPLTPYERRACGSTGLLDGLLADLGMVEEEPEELERWDGQD